jgi:hypothetical protein
MQSEIQNDMDDNFSTNKKVAPRPLQRRGREVEFYICYMKDNTKPNTVFPQSLLFIPVHNLHSSSSCGAQQ